MDAEWMRATLLVIDHTMEQPGHRSDARAQVPDSDVITVAVIAANYFQNHHERASRAMRQLWCLSGLLRRSRVTRRQRAGATPISSYSVGDLREDVFIIDSLPARVCRRVRARRSRNARGRVFCGYCAANDERLFGLRLHLICAPRGARVSEGRSGAAPLQRPLTT